MPPTLIVIIPNRQHRAELNVDCRRSSRRGPRRSWMGPAHIHSPTSTVRSTRYIFKRLTCAIYPIPHTIRLLSLTLSYFPLPAERATMPTLFQVLSELLPLSSLLPLSLDLLNRGSFVPESKSENLYAGALQVPACVLRHYRECRARRGAC